MDKNKKILFVGIENENIEKHCIAIFKLLKDKGYEIHIISNKEIDSQYCAKHYNLNLSQNKITNYKILKEIIKQNQYEFIQCYTFWGGVLTRLAAKNLNSKVIYISEKFPFYKGSNLRNWIIYYPIEKYLAKYTDILITTKEEDYILAKNKFKILKIKYINGLGVNEIDFKTKITDEERINLFEEFKFKKEDYILLSTGALSKDTNQILQIEAMMQIIPEYKNILLLIEGEGPLEEYYKNIIEKYDLNEHIKLIGKRKDILNIIKIANVLLVTNRKNDNIDDIIKTMFTNKPIIASEIKEHKEILKTEYLVNINNSNELVKKIEENIIEGKRKVCYDIEKYKLNNIVESMKKIYNF